MSFLRASHCQIRHIFQRFLVFLQHTSTLTPMKFTVAVHPLQALQPAAIHALFKLRVDIFVHEQQCAYAEIDDIDARPDTLHFLALADAASAAAAPDLLGTARLFPAVHGVPVAQFGRFCVRQDARGSRVAHSIMEAALRSAAELYPEHPVFLEAQSPLVGYYAAYGFEICGEEFLEDGIPHMPMITQPDQATG